MKILIVEDEMAAARRLEKLLLEVLPDAEVVGLPDSIAATVNWLDENPLPDLVLMDIHLADGESFQLFDIADIKCPVIFITAYDEYALKAFKVNAIDYLLKPVKRTELEAALQKFQARTASTSAIDYRKLAQAMQDAHQPKRFLIRLGQQIHLVDSSEIAYAYTDQKLTFMVSHQGKRFPSDQSLDRLEELLPVKDFFRINRQFIIHINAIREMHAYSKSRVKLDLNPATDLDTVVSTERSPLFKKWLQGH